MAVRHIDLSFESGDCEGSALRLIYALLPEWESSEGDVELIKFTEGITNTLLKAVKKRPGCTRSQIDQEAVLLRAYGKGTDVLIDRERETRAHSLLASRDLAPPLLARFDNGLLYKYIEGDVCSPEDLRRPEVYQAVARRMGQWHSTLPIAAISDLPDMHSRSTKHTSLDGDGLEEAGRPTPNVWTVMQAWIDALPVRTEEETKRKVMLDSELRYLSSTLGNTPGLNGNNYIFSHCDLLSGNVIIEPSTLNKASHGRTNGDNILSVSFIDYEYATPAPAAFDIANHFAEWGGFDCDHGTLPTRSQRLDFLRHYLSSYRVHGSPTSSAPSERELEQLVAQVDLFRGIPGFYWGIWALIQAEISQIDFDYAAYAPIRLGEYWDAKAEMNGERKRAGGEAPLRERRWAEE